MGGCASRPKEPSDAIPSENPAEAEVFLKAVEEVPAQGKSQNAEEKPLVDLSEPAGEISAAVVTEELAPGINELKSEAVVEISVDKEDQEKDAVEEIKVADEEAAEAAKDAAIPVVEHPLQ